MRRLLVVAAALLALSAYAQSTYTLFGRYCVALKPSADSSTSGWTAAGAGTHFSEVDDAVANASCYTGYDSDTSYLDCAKASTCVDVFDLTNSASYAAANVVIDYVKVQIVCKRVNGSTMSTGGIVPYLVISAVDYSAAITSQTCNSDAYSPQHSTGTDTRYVNPATGVRWTSADLDALQLKISKTTTTATWDTRLSDISVIVGYHYDYTTLQTPRILSGGGE